MEIRTWIINLIQIRINPTKPNREIKCKCTSAKTRKILEMFVARNIFDTISVFHHGQNNVHSRFRRFTRPSGLPEQFYAILVAQCPLCHATDPLTVQDAMNAKEASNWVDATNYKLDMSSDLNIWTPAFLSAINKAILSKWVIARKRDSVGSVVRIRAGLCSQGFTLADGLQYDSYYIPVTCFCPFLFLLDLNVRRKYVFLLFNVKHTF